VGMDVLVSFILKYLRFHQVKQIEQGLYKKAKCRELLVALPLFELFSFSAIRRGDRE